LGRFDNSPCTGFSAEIRPFRDSPDVDTMQGYGLDVSNYDEVKARAAEIYEARANGSMPCDGPWPNEPSRSSNSGWTRGVAP